MIDMAKKKQIVINNQELTPTVLAVKEDKKTVSMIGFLWITLIFIAFVAAVLYMPQISSFLKKYINFLPFVNFDIDDEPIPVVVPNNTTQNNEKDNTEPKETTETDNNTSEKQSYIETELVVDGKVLALSNGNGIIVYHS